MASLFHEYRSGLFALAFILLLGAASLTVVGEDQQAVIERMGQPERVINRFHPGGASGAGIVAKIPLRRLGTPEEIADVCWWVSGATYMTGSVIFTDGGLMCNL